MCDIDYLSTSQVNDPKTLARYIQQQTGTPWATLQDMVLLQKKCKVFFSHYPHLSYETLCHVADWAHRRKRRFSNVWKVVDAFRYAYQDGSLPEVDARVPDHKLEEQISEALNVETDSDWRMQLIATRSEKTRREVFSNWQTNRQPQLVGVGM